ncbi:MAG: flagellar assembly protein FliH [Candidatus Sedimenticola endophacoides]|uniref:Flagellar assembly protein FliH n=1 Tax=Candidatus Sedimenticola endophacoides TaxID=2548426 RepID=A0A6N4E4N4_9GAMM|nr:MAG: flagellar assembly protein FliH [Candidatus Sedimenticola endophacoides]PUE03876.1 MAG: flagellar assembly protein FliH [Candidatus Sedimenticola endophacoides]PUE05523.1 MAG: flagellar assembly protein FliH [Candidatus Sedimenticola endophacoides]
MGSRGGGPGGSPMGGPLTAEQLSTLQKQAYDEGFEEGKQAGFEFGHNEALVQAAEQAGTRLQLLDRVLQTLQEPLRELDEQVEAELVELSAAMVRQLVRREIQLDPAQIIGVVRDALGVLPVSARGIRLVLHPEDAALIRQVYAVEQKELSWEIIEDPVLGRGGCRVITDTSQVDATLESRLAALIAPVLSGERDIDADATDETGG